MALPLASVCWSPEESERKDIWLNFLMLFGERLSVGLEEGWTCKGMSFSAFCLSFLDKVPEEGCRYAVCRFFNACFWYIFPGDAAIAQDLFLDKPPFATSNRNPLTRWQSYFFIFTCAVPNQSLFVLHFDGWMVLDNRINSVTPRSIKPSIIIGNVRLSWGYDVIFFSYCNLLIDVYEVIIWNIWTSGFF